MEKYSRIDRKLVRKCVLFDYYQDTIQIPDGRTEIYDFLGHNGAAGAVAVRDDGMLIMVRQWRNALDRFTLEIPAGGRNGDEPTDIAAARELKEETGYTAANIRPLLSINTTVAFCNEKIDIYLATGLSKGEQSLDDDEFVNVEAWSLEDLLKMIDDGIITDAKTISALLKYYRMVKEEA